MPGPGERAHVRSRGAAQDDLTSATAEFSQLGLDEAEDGTSAPPAELPEWACKYCGIHSPASVARCNLCKKWFCNSRGGLTGSHIVNHLVRSKVRRGRGAPRARPG